MTEFQVSDVVRVEMPRGYSTRGVLGVSLMFATSQESKFEGAIGTITEINPVGPQSVHQYLVDFRTHDNSRVGIPWQAQWFREEWLGLRERATVPTTPASKTEAATQTWPTRPGTGTAVVEPEVAQPLEDNPAARTAEASASGTPTASNSGEATAAPGIAHPEAKLYSAGAQDFAPEGVDPSSLQKSELSAEAMTIAHPEAKLFSDGARDFAPSGSGDAGIAASDIAQGINIGGSTADDHTPGVEDRSAAQLDVYVSDSSSVTNTSIVVERGDGWIRVANTNVCPDGFPIKGNENSGIFHAPTDKTFARTVPEICFESEEAALAKGFRAPRNRG